MGTPANPFQHIDLRVRDRAEAREFYARLLPALGLTREENGKNFTCFHGTGEPPGRPWFGFTEDPAHQANGNRIAFVAASPEEVDRLAALAVAAGAVGMSGPKACPDYSPTYYAAFFDDPSGNALEICYVGDQ